MRQPPSPGCGDRRSAQQVGHLVLLPGAAVRIPRRAPQPAGGRTYERAWREGDPAAVAGLSTEDARYRRSPYEPSTVGHAEIEACWREDDGQGFTVTAGPVAVEGRDAVVRLEVRDADPAQEYRDLWVLRFAADGRVEDGRQASTASYSPAGAPRPLTTWSATTREATQACTCPVPL